MATFNKVNINSVDVIATNGTVNTCGFLPSTTISNFRQTAAPVGWTKNTTYDNYSLRLVNGTVTNRAAESFTTVLASGKSISGAISGRSLSTSTIPSHGHSHNQQGQNCGHGWNDGARTSQGNPWRGNGRTTSDCACGGGCAHDHGNTFCINMNVRYVDFISATKD